MGRKERSGLGEGRWRGRAGEGRGAWWAVRQVERLREWRCGRGGADLTLVSERQSANSRNVYAAPRYGAEWMAVAWVWCFGEGLHR